MILSFSVDQNWSIGYEGDMLFKISQDLKRFKSNTVHQIVIMGRKTFESLPNQKPLVDRINIIVTRNPDYQVEGALVVHNFDELDLLLSQMNANKQKREFLIGGGALVAQLFDRCEYAYITKVDRSYEHYDTVIPNLDQDPNWRIVKEGEWQMEGDMKFKYVDYQRTRKA